MRAWLQFYGAVRLPVGSVFQAQTVELTPSYVTCVHSDLMRQQLSIIFQPTIATLPFNVIQKSSKHSYLIVKGTSTPPLHLHTQPAMLYNWPSASPCIGSRRAVEGPRPCFLFSCQLACITEVNKVPYLLLLF